MLKYTSVLYLFIYLVIYKNIFPYFLVYSRLSSEKQMIKIQNWEESWSAKEACIVPYNQELISNLTKEEPNIVKKGLN